MFAIKLFTCVVLFMGVNGRSITHEEHEPYFFINPDIDYEEQSPVLMDYESMVPIRAARQRRQAHGSFGFNSDGTSSLNMKVPFAGNDKNIVSAIGGLDFGRDQRIAAGTAGLSLDNINGHGLTLTKSHLPGVGDRMAAAGNLNLFHNNNHNLNANAFAARTTLNNQAIPSFNTVGGGLDYMFKNKIGAGLNVAHTPLFQKTDYSATGNLNIFRNPSSSLDFNAGFSKSVSPFMPSQSWQPTTGFSFKKFF